MNKAEVIMKSVKTEFIKHQPAILVGVGIMGLVSAAVVAVRATPKATRLIEERKKQKHTNKLTTMDSIQATWKCYLPATIIGATSIACIVGGTMMNDKRNTALLAAYAIVDGTLRDYKSKVVETIGVEKVAEVRDAVAKEKLERNPITGKEVIITGNGTCRFYDAMTGARFDSDIETVRHVENVLNKRLRNEMYISLNEFYHEMGITPVTAGDILGWDVDGDIEFEFSSQIDSDGVPCIVLSYDVTTRYKGY